MMKKIYAYLCFLAFSRLGILRLYNTYEFLKVHEPITCEVHRLRIWLHFTKSIRNKQERVRGYLALEDRRIKSNFSRSNRSIEEVGRSVQRKNPKRRRKKMRMARRGRGGWLKRGFLAPRHGANDAGAKSPSTSTPRRMVLAPMTLAPWRYSLAPITVAPRSGSIFEILSARGIFKRIFRKKGQKNKKDGDKWLRLYKYIHVLLSWIHGP
jgi:hypothetical protein